MASYLLDTNHASPLVTLGHPLRDLILKRLRAGDTFALCVPVVTETIFGISLLKRAAHNRREWENLRPLLSCYVPDEADAMAAAQLQLGLRRVGWQLATVDALIAACALRLDYTLLTTDGDFNAISGLTQENWLEALS